MGAVMRKVKAKQGISKTDLEFLRKNTKYSEIEIRHWYRNFQKDCPNGKMNGYHFLKAYQELFPEQWRCRVSDESTAAFLDFVFEAFDHDKSGNFDFKEFLLFINTMSDGTPEEKLEGSFRIFDLDGNGTISKVELFKVVKALLTMQSGSVTGSAEATQLIMNKLDQDGNGNVTMKEFVSVCKDEEIMYSLLVENKAVVMRRLSTVA